jgi:hypothetical protein
VLCELLLEDDDFLQGVGVVLLLALQLGFEIGVALFQPLNVLLPSLYFRVNRTVRKRRNRVRSWSKDLLIDPHTRRARRADTGPG